MERLSELVNAESSSKFQLFFDIYIFSKIVNCVWVFFSKNEIKSISYPPFNVNIDNSFSIFVFFFLQILRNNLFLPAFVPKNCFIYICLIVILYSFAEMTALS